MHINRAKYGALAVLALLMSIILNNVMFLYAQTPDLDMDYVPVIYNEKNGAYSSNVNDIIQSEDGKIYICNSTGLISYNGRRFTRIGSGLITEANTIVEDMFGTLWVATNDEGLVIVQDENYSVFDRSTGFDSDCVRAIVPDYRAGMYVSTTGSVYHFDRQLNCERVRDDSCSFTVSMACDSSGVLAGVTNSGDVYFIDGGEVLSDYADKISKNVCTSVNLVNNNFVFATYEGEVITVKYTQGNIECTSHYFEELSGINSIYNDGDRLWILADTGIGYLIDDEFTKVTFDDFKGYYQSMFRDYEGNYWIASSRYGVLKLARNDFRHISEKAVLTKGVVNSTLISGGYIYAGMDTGLVILDRDTYESIENSLTDMLEGVKIKCIIRDNDDNIWIATYGSTYGLIRYNDSGINIYNTEYGMPQDSVNFVKLLGDGTVAAVTKNGIVFIKNGSISSIIDEDDGFNGSEILDILDISESTIVLCSDGDGILVLNEGKIVNRITTENGLPSNVVRRIIHYEDGFLLVTGNSICHMKDFIIERLEFSYSGMYDIIAGIDDEFWILSNSGIFRISAKSLFTSDNSEYVLYDSDMGFQSVLTSNSWSGTDEERNVYLCCQNGIVVMPLASEEEENTGYTIDIKSIRADDKRTSSVSFVELPKNTVSVVFEPDFNKFGYEKLMILYFLEGYDNSVTIIDSSELPEKITYTNLPGGDYVFHMRLLRNDGKEEISSVDVNIFKETSLYEQPLIRSLLTVLIILLILLFGHIFIRIQLTNAEKKKNMYRNITKQTIMAIAKTIDAKDEYTNGHSLRVAGYSMEIAKRLGMNTEQQEDIYYCGLLHDIGKIGIPDEILNKTSGLTDEEYEIIKTHPSKGAEILSDVTTIPHIVEGAKYHHERYDGLGYNEGLKGNEIPLFARIIAVADTFDAMTSSRCYRVGLDKDYVVNELKRVSGKQLDPAFVNVMLGMINDGFVPDSCFTSG